MGDVVLTLLMFLLLPVLSVTGLATFAMVTLRRTNRVAAGGPLAPAPVRWLWSPGLAASLHRRLRYASQLAGAASGPAQRSGWRRRPVAPTSLAGLAREVVDQAIFLDRAVVSANMSQRGITRAHALTSLEHEVRAVEDAARRVHRLAEQQSQLRYSGGASALPLNDRIALMEAAYQELQAHS